MDEGFFHRHLDRFVKQLYLHISSVHGICFLLSNAVSGFYSNIDVTYFQEYHDNCKRLPFFPFSKRRLWTACPLL